MNYIDLTERVRTLAYEGQNYEFIKEDLINYKGQSLDLHIELATRDAHEYIANYQLAQQSKSAALTQIIIGGVLLVLGLILILYTYVYQIDHYRMNILSWGLASGGFVLIRRAYHTYRTPLSELLINKRRGKIDKRFSFFRGK